MTGPDLPTVADPDLHGVRLELPLYQDHVGPLIGQLALALVIGVAWTPGFVLVFLIGYLLRRILPIPEHVATLHVGPTGLRIARTRLGAADVVTLAWDDVAAVEVEGRPPALVVQPVRGDAIRLEWEATRDELHAVVTVVEVVRAERAVLPELPVALARLTDRVRMS